jgi:hypothetical protein
MQTIATSPGEFNDLDVEDLPGPGLVAATIANSLKTARTVLYYGHGRSDSLGSPPLISAVDAAVVTDGVIVAFACDAGGQLAEDATAAGLGCFLGFSDSLLVPVDSVEAPWSRWMEAVITGPLMTNGTADDVREALADRFIWIYKMFKGGPFANTPNAPIVWLAADWNLRHLKLVGEGACALI